MRGALQIRASQMMQGASLLARQSTGPRNKEMEARFGKWRGHKFDQTLMLQAQDM